MRIRVDLPGSGSTNPEKNRIRIRLSRRKKSFLLFSIPYFNVLSLLFRSFRVADPCGYTRIQLRQSGKKLGPESDLQDKIGSRSDYRKNPDTDPTIQKKKPHPNPTFKKKPDQDPNTKKNLIRI